MQNCLEPLHVNNNIKRKQNNKQTKKNKLTNKKKNTLYHMRIAQFSPEVMLFAHVSVHVGQE